MMPETQQAVVQYALAPMSVELREVPVPAIGPEDVLLKVGAVSVCGSDVHQAYGTHSWAVNIPVTLGHEFCGTIAGCGAAVRGYREGDRVVSETAAVICGECLMCRSGRYNLCPSRKGFGYGVDGAMAEYVKVPARCLHHVPDRLPFELACLTEPHAVSYNAMCVNATIRPGDLFASGTISGPDRGSCGSLIELTWRGTETLKLSSGEERSFLEDGDTVTLTGYCEAPGKPRIGFGQVSGTVLPS